MEHDAPLPVEHVRLRHLRDPVAAGHVARAVLQHRERQRVRGDEAPRVAGDVVEVDAEEGDARLRYCVHSRSSAFASLLHGMHHDAQKLSTTGLPRSEARETVPAAVEAAQRERRRRRADARGVLLVGELPDEQGEQAGDERERGGLARRASAVRVTASAPPRSCGGTCPRRPSR